jgi:uncharacterized membrane protein YkoI
MNLTPRTQRRVLIPAFVTAATLAIGGAAWADLHDDLRGAERGRVAEAAVRAAGGGTAVDVEHSDEGHGGYEVEVRKPDSSETEVLLDRNLKVLHREDHDSDGDAGDDADDVDDAGTVPDDNDDDPESRRSNRTDEDDRVLTEPERTAISAAATKAVGPGTVTDLEASDDPGSAFEAEVRDRQGTEWDVKLDAEYRVVHKAKDS